MWEFWDKIYCINLDRRTDRWEQCLVEFDKIGLTKFVTRFPAIEFPSNEKTYKHQGCYASHIAIMQEAIKNDYNHVIIFEDDVQFFVNQETLNKSFNDLLMQKWDVFFLGIRPNHLIKITNHLLKPFGGTCTHAIGYNKKALKIVCSSLEKQYKKNDPQHYVVPIDYVGVYEHMSDLNCFSTYPLACAQRRSYSDIRKEITDFALENLKDYEEILNRENNDKN